MNFFSKKIAVILLICFSPLPVLLFSQQPATSIAKDTISKPAPIPDIELDGLLVNETISKLARDFYRYFYAHWTAPEGVSDYYITVKELPTQGIAVRVAILVNNNVVVQRFLPPRVDLLESQATQIAEFISNFVREGKHTGNLDDVDLKGTGIF